MKFKTILIFGAPGSGKGTQGKVLGSIPGFYHCACGDVFRSIDLRTEIGKAFLEYSSKGQLVPDDLTISLWSHHIENQQTLGRYKPEIDRLILDGIPRNVSQAEKMDSQLDVQHIFHLNCPDQSKLIERLKRRALKENRLDDANEELIRNRLKVYEAESRPVLDFYGKDLTTEVDAMMWPYEVLRTILNKI